MADSSPDEPFCFQGTCGADSRPQVYEKDRLHFGTSDLQLCSQDPSTGSPSAGGRAEGEGTKGVRTGGSVKHDEGGYHRQGELARWSRIATWIRGGALKLPRGSHESRSRAHKYRSNERRTKQPGRTNSQPWDPPDPLPW